MPISLSDTAWMMPYLDVLPRTNDLIFTEVWHHNRFVFGEEAPCADEIDLWSARLVCAAMDMSQRLLVVLPDRAPHRPSLLFASCLVMDALDTILYPDIEPNKVVYFGTSIGIREQLSAVKVQDLVLDQVFPAYRTTRNSAVAKSLKPKGRGTRSITSIASTLPQVICAYSPADPRKVIDQFEPTWLAVDCSDASSIRWLPSLLKYAEHLELPVVAWCQSPLSATVRDFSQAGGIVFHWPRAELPPHSATIASEMSNKAHTDITPIIVDTQNSRFAENLQTAYQALVEVTKSTAATDRLLRDCLNIGWRYLQSIELLPIPLALYEVEVLRFWNVTPLSKLQQTFLRFIEAAQDVYTKAAPLLYEAYHALADAHAAFASNEPPLWTMLSKECLKSETNTEPRIYIFSSEYRKQLFIFALLSRYNLTENDLRLKGIWLATLKDFYRGYLECDKGNFVAHNGTPTLPLETPYLPIILGLPSSRQAAYIEPFLSRANGEIVIYPYQHSTLIRRIQEWNAALAPKPADQSKCLDKLAIKAVHLNAIPSGEPRVSLVDSEAVVVTPKGTSKSNTPLPWTSLDPVQELTFLFEHDEEQGPEQGETQDHSLGSEPSSQFADAWIDSAIELQLEGNWHATFATDDTVQVVVGTGDAHTEERYVRSLRAHDRILFIVGQRRQNLYDLIITRVHAHPAIELHLAMIRRWHEELSAAFGAWKKEHNASLDDLLAALRKKGSHLTSTQTLRLWLMGEVLCPEDTGDLLRVAEILHMPFVKDNHRHIDKAAQRLRNIHRALARRLNRWLQQEAAGALREGKPDTSILDKELGLTFSDFRDSLLILRVESILHREGLYLRSSLGQLEREDA